MSKYQELLKWLHEMKHQNYKNPAIMPITREEILSVRNEERVPIYTHQSERKPSQFLDIDTFTTDYAKEMRTRQCEIPLTLVCSELTYDKALMMVAELYTEQTVLQELKMRLEAYVCSDTSYIDIELWADKHEKFKRFFLQTKWISWLLTILCIRDWFRINTKKVRIKGQVLYPYLNIQLPHHRHHIKFNIMS